MIYTYVLSRAGNGVRGPEDALGSGFGPSQLERDYADLYNTPIKRMGNVDKRLRLRTDHAPMCRLQVRTMPVNILNS